MTLIYGHRGARGEAPENTLASFQACLASGVKCCELDLHLSKDGQLMVIHDTKLKRTTGRSGLVGDFTAAQLVQMDARHNTVPWPEPCPIPRLEQLFKECSFEHWQLEIKATSSRRAQQTVQTIAQLCTRYALQNKVIITSSSRKVLHAAKKFTPHLARGLVSDHVWFNPIKIALHYDCKMLILNKKLAQKKRIKQAQKAGLHVSIWTVNEPTLMRQLESYGADSLITDFPGLAIATLGSR
ncbi:glycerophosphodiester phosphodiesterase family protein [Denitrificimonas sp. JX-1]|uniref:Glycerophosphodiester phosphodiesterase family protein n=1 Tax=Denitrificimonas halotolerans TaxID=3098930 RepID=A0ABU5GNT3_9GAMM|nr:glycerophosphodiester phosphodiesterase family protein [Denitrificimonas sp. JX-1]MDY7217980.1 glycerophosphodiester phosphodiesterase family protein [Denitrificimonas sp. JX-1]